MLLWLMPSDWAIRSRCAKGDCELSHSGHFPRRIHFGDGDMRFERHVLDVRDAVLAFDDRRTLPPGFFHIALADLEMVGDIRAWLGQDEVRQLILAELRVNDRRCGAGAELRVEHRGEHFVFHLDQVERLLG